MRNQSWIHTWAEAEAVIIIEVVEVDQAMKEVLEAIAEVLIEVVLVVIIQAVVEVLVGEVQEALDEMVWGATARNTLLQKAKIPVLQDPQENAVTPQAQTVMSVSTISVQEKKSFRTRLKWQRRNGSCYRDN